MKAVPFAVKSRNAFWLLLLFLSAALHAAQPKEALLIANGKYSHFAGLAHPVPDAAKLSAALEQIGFRVRVVSDGNREQMLDAISEFERGLRNTGAIAFFHYGGHGVQVDGKNYLLPADADIPDERRVATRAVALDEVMTAMDAAAARASIIVIDACRDNPLPAGSRRNLARGLSVVGMKPKNSIVIYAAEAGSKALDGLFTPILASSLRQKGRTIDQIMKSVRSEVYAKSSGQQTPGEYNQLFEELFLWDGEGNDLAVEKIVIPTPAPIAASTPSHTLTNKPAQPIQHLFDFEKWVIEYVNESDKAFRNADYETALSKIKNLDELVPNDPGILLRIGRIFEKTGKFTDACTIYNRVLGLPNLPQQVRAQTEKRISVLSCLKSYARDEFGLQPGATLGIEETRLTEEANGSKNLRIAIKSRPNCKIDPRQMVVHIFFWERDQAGNKSLTKSKVLTEWLSPPVNWSGQEPELLKATYNPPHPSDTNAPNLAYEGYVVGIYYNNEHQDTRYNPDSLADDNPLPLYLKSQTK